MEQLPIIGISRCLLGDSVNDDGSHSLSEALAQDMARAVEWVPVCPMIQCGLGSPRETLRLEGGTFWPSLVGVTSRIDYLEKFVRTSARLLRELHSEGVAGFVFRTASPACGLDQVPVYDAKGKTAAATSGIFARAFMDRFPDLPVSDEARLAHPAARDIFLRRIRRSLKATA